MSVNYQNTNNQLNLLYQQAFYFANNAVKEDNIGNVEAAIKAYLDFKKVVESILQLETNQIKKEKIREKCQEYNRRVTELKNLTTYDKLMIQAKHKLDQISLQYEQKNNQEVLELYKCTLEILMKAAAEGTRDKSELIMFMKKIFERAEDLKGLPTTMSSLQVRSANPGAENSSPICKLSGIEDAILKKNSIINGKNFPQWPEGPEELNEQFAFERPFVDKDVLELSIAQKEKFDSWRRPSEIMNEPELFKMVSSTAIKQDVVTDCSFVASLCVSAAYQKRYGNKQLITRCIFPKNKYGHPFYNPSGKYVVKLIFNGTPRKVIIDDFLPFSRDGTLMCTFSTNKNELWPSIIEKAYLKLMGGYNFPGSNSGIDLYILTGWIPEQIFIDKYFEKEIMWKRMLNSQPKDDKNPDQHALITIATGHLSDTKGLVPTHAYAVLDIREVNDLRLLLVKNPWSHKRWTGPFSHLDRVNWTPELMKELDYDIERASNIDDGIFWIDFDSVCEYFYSIHMNWNPERFHYVVTKHSSWPINVGLRKDTMNLAYNPQFCLEINNESEQPSEVYLLLSKHITVTEEENEDFITLHVYNDTNGEKIYSDKTPWKKGAYVNSPHILVRFDAPTGITRYTIVVAQINRVKSLDFTLKCYSISPATLSEIPKKYQNVEFISGKWTNQTAGGNPMLLMLEGPKKFAMDVRMIWSNGKRIASLTTKDILMKSSGYRNGFCYCEKDDIKPGDYTIIVSTYEPGLIGEFTLTVASNVTFNVTSIPLEGAGMFKKVIYGQWIKGFNAMGIQQNFHLNPSYHLKISEMTTLKIRLQTPEMNPIPTHIRVFEKRPNNSLGREIANSGDYASAGFIQGVCTDDISLPSNDQGYIIVFCTWEKDVSAQLGNV
ncbi:calpain-7 [Rhizophagus clarus]|uniref:Calpain-7 n=1 Tax=Rhizophagus clarus TaxID=94130 RepID=A0A8H3KTT4_9GLOM|nr:calpain-7 [Rhizophagus clarus]